jgi:tetratricopeptide (TPR) repeat protein
MLRLEPLCSWAYFYRAGLRLALGDARGAVEDLSALKSIPPEWLFICRDLQVPPPARYPRTLETLREAQRLDPSSAWTHVLESFHFRVAQRWEESVRAVDRALELAPEDPTILGLSARLKYIYRLPAGAAAAMERARALSPRCSWINAWLGETRRYAGDLRGAHRLLTLAIAEDPRYIIAHSWRGSVSRLLGKTAQALSDLNIAITDPDLAGGDYSLAWAFHERSLLKRGLGDVSGALSDLNRAHRRNLRFVWAGDLYRKERSDLQSVAFLDRAVAAHPRAAWAWAWRGQTRTADEPEAALRDLNEASRLSPRLAWARAWKAEALFLLGRPEEALAGVNAAVRLDSGYGYAYLLRARLHSAAGRWAKAEADLAKALELDCICAEAWAYRGRAAFQLKRHDDAEAYLSKAIEIDPKYKDALRWRAELRRARGENESALSDLRAALAGHGG